MHTVDQLLVQACDETRLDDFGGDSFREGLDVLVTSLRDEAHLNEMGEGFLTQRIVQHLGQRLRVEDWYRRHPEIDDEVIEAPLFGMGLPRTGSTALSFLLAQDPDVRYLRMWESGTPCPPPSTVEGPDPRRGGDEVVKAGTRDHVPTDIDGPMECLELMALDFRSDIFLAFARIPSYADWLIAADLTSTYEYEKRVLKLLQWGEPNRPWRLKSPVHVLYLDALDRVFPDARFVMTHRDPTDVMLSVADVYADIGGVFTDDLDIDYIGRVNVDHWATGMQRAVSFRDAGNDHRFHDVGFRAMFADPIGEVGRLYDWLGAPVSERFESQMRSWWQHNSENREPSPKREPEEFGLDLDEVRPRFADYVARAEGWIGAPLGGSGEPA